MKDYGCWNYRYATPLFKYVITLKWSKDYDYIRCNHYRYNSVKCDYEVIHTYIDVAYTKADVITAKQFFEVLIDSFPTFRN